MQDTIAIIAGLVSLASSVPYIVDIIKGKTRPNIVTWFTFTVLNAINAFAAVQDGAVPTAILSTCSVITTGTVAVLGIKRGIKKYTTFDIACQVMAIIGIMAWQFTGNASAAVAMVIAVSILAVMPTIRHAWIEPHAETWQTFALGGLAAGLTITSLSDYSFVALGFPVYLIIVCAVLTGIVLLRRKSVALEAKP